MSLWIAAQPLVLASKSQVRRQILAASGLPVEVRPAAIDERAIEAGAGAIAADQAARLLAHAKAAAVAKAMPGRLVLAADQTLSLGTQRFSKPADRAAARQQLRALCGQSHNLHAALVLMRDGAVLFEHADLATLTMRQFSDQFLESYLDAAGDAVTTSVGGYQIEGAGIHLFQRIAGDYFTILGLPLLPLLDFLRRNGFIAS
jgi:septum formation protein